ncbi:MAG: hypothetical protein ACXAC8_10550 [Candidatus Hodarchaeales archaeon]|jgi:2-phospho-L-lactate guanylyltransferase
MGLKSVKSDKPLIASTTLILVPIKDFINTKTRIKSIIPLEYARFVEKLVKITFFNTIEIIKSLPYPFGVISPSFSIIEQSRRLGAHFTYRDLGIDLNKALKDAVLELQPDQPILIIMPDLPFIDRSFFHLLNKEATDVEVIIIPSISSNGELGTAALYLEQPNLLSFQFGENSNKRFQAEAKSKNLRYHIFHNDPFARDLDTITDIKYLKEHLTMTFEPSRFNGVLNKLDMIAP